MSTPSNPGAAVYTQGFGSAPLSALGIIPIVANRAPGPSDVQGPSGPLKVGQAWVDVETRQTFILAAVSASLGVISATWNQTSGSGSGLQTLTGNSGVATEVASNINLLGSNTITTVGSGSTLTISGSVSGFPITPYVVGPSGQAGYQTIQAALNAANTNPGGVVYIQPGTYTENLNWPLGVSAVSTEPTSFFSEVTIVGDHIVVAGNSSFRQIGAAAINFQGTTGSLFSGSITGLVSIALIDCIVRMNGTSAYIFDLPSISSSSSCVFELTDVSVISGGTINTPSGVTLNVTSSSLGSNPSAAITNAGGIWTFSNSTAQETITVTGGALGANGCTFSEPIIASGMLSAAVSLIRCSILSGDAAGVTMSGNTSGIFTDCTIDSGATYAIDGTTSGSISVGGMIFITSAGINPALRILWPTALVGGTLVATNDVAVVTGTVFTSTLASAAGTPQALITATSSTANDSWIKIYNAGTAYFIPAWTTAVP